MNRGLHLACSPQKERGRKGEKKEEQRIPLLVIYISSISMGKLSIFDTFLLVMCDAFGGIPLSCRTAALSKRLCAVSN